MKNLADDGFGNLVSVLNPYGTYTTVFAKVGGKLVRYEIGTANHVAAIEALRKELPGGQVRTHGKWGCGPVLALIEGGV